METEPKTVDAGTLSIEIPADCPDASVFQKVITEELTTFFREDQNRAAFCKSEYDRCQDTPAPFSYNWEARSHYQAAQMALSQAAKTWQRFEGSVRDRFSDFCLDDGEDQTPAIPGWHLDELKASVREKPQAIAAAKEAERPQPPERTWRLDQMKVQEAPQAGSWRDRRPGAEPARDRENDTGKGRAR